jgi:hypothetical protein
VGLERKIDLSSGGWTENMEKNDLKILESPLKLYQRVRLESKTDFSSDGRTENKRT